MTHLDFIHNKILDRTTIINHLSVWRIKSDQIVFTNGCFDILHMGHVHLLATAASLGHRLVVGINSDESIKSIKGPSRPVNNFESRAFMLASLQMVDAVIKFDEETPIELIKHIKPEILVKGSDWDINEVVGKNEVESYGGRVELVDLIEGYSTSALINKIKQN